MKRIGAYIRVSTEEQARIQDGSLVSQKSRILEYIEAQNKIRKDFGILVDIYCDEGKSAKSIKGRPEFQRLLSDIQSGRVDLIVSTELSRLSRSIRDFCEIWDLLKKFNASFITLRENFDTTTASGEMMVFNLINFAQYERKQTAERIAANWQSRAKRGLFNGGTIPLGYDRNPKNKGELVVNEDEAKTVRYIFELFFEKESLRKTCVALTETGVYQKRFVNKHGFEKGGRPFTIDSLRSVLTNVAYIGKRPAVSEGERALITAVWKPIIDEDMFNKVRARLNLNKNRYKPESWKKYPFPLTEIVVCGDCGKHMGGKSGTGRKEKHFYYGHAQIKDPTKKVSEIRCQVKNIRAPRLEELILKCLKTTLSETDLIKKWIAIYKSQTLNDQPEVLLESKRLDTEINSLGRKISNLVNRIAELPDEVPANSFYEQIKQMTEKKQTLALAKEKLKTRIKDFDSQEIDEDGLQAKIKRTIAHLEEVPKEKQRPIFQQLIHSIEIHPTKIKIGVYAPAGPNHESDSPETQKATGTDGLSIDLSNFSSAQEPKILPFDPNRRAGSSIVGSGAPGQT